VPVLPPLPFPPFPIPVHSGEPDAAAPVSDALPATPSTTAASKRLQATLSASTKAEVEALLRSRWHESWYGWQTLTFDAAAVGVLLVGAALGPPGIPESDHGPLSVAAPASAALYMVGPGVVHMEHGHVWKGFASLGLRVAMPLAGFAVGYFASPGQRQGRAMEDGEVGAAMGIAGAMVTDAAALGWDRWYGVQTPALVSMRASF
jgi:hypothetical protein